MALTTDELMVGHDHKTTTGTGKQNEQGQKTN